MPITVYLDIETRKVPTPPGFCMPNGEPLRTRWQVFAIGVVSCAISPRAEGFYQSMFTEPRDASDRSERGLLRELSLYLQYRKPLEIVYQATRQFDEMVLKGRFTNARRAHLPEPGPWPHLPGTYVWRCLRPDGVKEAGGVASKDVPVVWDSGNSAPVLKHLRDDVLRMVGR